MPDLALYFRALADRKRLDIVEYLAQHEEVTVTRLGAALHLSQPLISWHLRKLRRAEIVHTKRVGREVLCSLNRSGIQRAQEWASEVFGLTERDSGPDQQARSLEAGHR